MCGELLRTESVAYQADEFDQLCKGKSGPYAVLFGGFKPGEEYFKTDKRQID